MGALRAYSVLAATWGICSLACETPRASDESPQAAASSLPASEAEAHDSPGPNSEDERRQPPSIAVRRAAAVSGQLMVEFQEVRRSLELTSLLTDLEPQVVRSWDPYYAAWKEYYAVPLAKVLERAETALGHPTALDRVEQVQFVASDGYTATLSRKLVEHPAAHLAFGHTHVDQGFEPIGEQGADARPLYLIWEGKEFSDRGQFPRPWALSTLRFLVSADAYQHLAPQDGWQGNVLAEKGHQLFAGDCLRCHSINQEGGKLGPELNVPRNILSYRDEATVRAFIRNPNSFRYSAMPPHPDLTESDLDALIAYLRLMGRHQHDPRAKLAQETPP